MKTKNKYLNNLVSKISTQHCALFFFAKKLKKNYIQDIET